MASKGRVERPETKYGEKSKKMRRSICGYSRADERDSAKQAKPMLPTPEENERTEVASRHRGDANYKEHEIVPTAK